MLRSMISCIVVGVCATLVSFAQAELVTTNLVLRYETVGDSPYTTDSGRVTSWRDQATTNVTNAIPPVDDITTPPPAVDVPTVGPTVVAGATPTGKPAFLFNASNLEYLQAAGVGELDSRALSWFIVFKNQAGNGALFSAGYESGTLNDSVNMFSQLEYLGTGMEYACGRDYDNGAWKAAASSGTVDTDWHVVGGVWNGLSYEANGNPAETMQLVKDGVTLASVGGVDCNPAGNLFVDIGRYGNSSVYYSGQIAAVVVYNTCLTPADVASVTSYLQGTYLVEVPEPGTLALLATGLFGLLAYAWKKRK